MKQRNAHQDAAQESRMRVLETRCVLLHVGDIWTVDLFGDVRITGFERKVTFANGSSVGQDANSRSAVDDERFSLPWPLVTFESESGQKDYIGAPGFMFATLIARGTGKKWDPKKEGIRIREEDRKKKEKEDEKSRERDRGEWGRTRGTSR